MLLPTLEGFFSAQKATHVDVPSIEAGPLASCSTQKAAVSGEGVILNATSTAVSGATSGVKASEARAELRRGPLGCFFGVICFFFGGGNCLVFGGHFVLALVGAIFVVAFCEPIVDPNPPTNQRVPHGVWSV